ncbi:MAG: TonB-dependent receptor [Tidjanibacter sp.]|nr:TonB-dependent receptor [Tidjanibacter sp.]
MKRLLVILACLLACGQMVAQRTAPVSGVVTDKSNGEPLIGVTVSLEGTSTVTITDYAGKYTINVPFGNAAKKELTFSYMGYNDLTVAVTPTQSRLDVALEVGADVIEDVVVVGYGTMKRSDLTGAVASVDSEDIQRTPVATIDQAFAGRIAGVTVNSSTGQPGAAAEVRIRGIGTVNNSAPIYVVDGVITEDIGFLNPGDIASTEVLKDASSTAIYGSRGANGVIIVTTKTGAKDRAPQISLSAYAGVQNRWRKLDLMGRDEMAATLIAIGGVKSEMSFYEKHGFYKWLKAYRLGKSPYYPTNLDYSTVETDWQDEVFRANAPIHNYHLSVEGGSSKSQYSFSAGYFSQDGTIIGSNYERLTLRLNSSYNLNKWLKVGESLSLITSSSRWAMNNSSSAGASILSAALAMAPWDPTHYPEGSVNVDGKDLSGEIAAGSNFKNVVNPFSMVEHSHPNNSDQRLLGNIYLEANPIKGLTFRSSVSMDQNTSMSRSYSDKYLHSDYDKADKNFISANIGVGRTMFYENTLTYALEQGDHRFSAMVGQTTEEYTYYSMGGAGASIANPSENNWYLNQATEDKTESGDSAARTRRFSLLGRLFYNYADRYMATINFRADASSKFPENLWGYFPSMALAWRLSEESFLEDVDAVDNLKVRFGWGRIGNDKIAEGAFTQSVFSSSNTFTGYPFGTNQELATGSTILTYVNNNGRWEATEQLNFGVDFSLWNNRLYGTVDIFERNTYDMLLSVTAPAHVGNRYAATANVGTVRNRGVELTIGHGGSFGNGWEYDVNINGSVISNQLTRLNGGERVYGSYTICDEGLPLYSFWGYEYEGIYQSDEEVKQHQYSVEAVTEKMGDARYKDQNGDGVINDDDLVAIGSAFPWLTYGANFSLRKGGFDVSLFFQGVYGNQIYNAVRLRTEGDGTQSTLSTTMRDVWSSTNLTGTIPNPGASGSSRNFESSSRYVEDGSYLRLKNLQIGYTLPEKLASKVGIGSCRLYVTMSNLLTFTSYTGYDPEVGGGVDWGNYPQSRTITLGTNINF